jgi:hypothetical protein
MLLLLVIGLVGLYCGMGLMLFIVEFKDESFHADSLLAFFGMLALQFIIFILFLFGWPFIVEVVFENWRDMKWK